jgi:hypothetical protein
MKFQSSSGRNIRNATRLCSVEGCGQTMRISGYCAKHYSEWSRLDAAAKAAAKAARLAGLPVVRKPWVYEGRENELIAAQEKNQ